MFAGNTSRAQEKNSDGLFHDQINPVKKKAGYISVFQNNDNAYYFIFFQNKHKYI